VPRASKRLDQISFDQAHDWWHLPRIWIYPSGSFFSPYLKMKEPKVQVGFNLHLWFLPKLGRLHEFLFGWANQTYQEWTKVNLNDVNYFRYTAVKDAIPNQNITELVNFNLIPNTCNGAEGYNNKFNNIINTLQQQWHVLTPPLLQSIYLGNIQDRLMSTSRSSMHWGSYYPSRISIIHAEKIFNSKCRKEEECTSIHL